MIKLIIIYIYNFLFRNRVKSYLVPLNFKVNNGVKIDRFAQLDSYSEVGAYTFIGAYVNITKSSIGRYCSIAPGVKIGQGEHDLNDISTSSIFYSKPYEKLTRKECKVGNDVWIGSNAVILRGVSVGTGAVVGAGAIVTKDVPDFAIVVGVPARLIRFRFDKSKISKLLKSEWWLKDIEEAKKVIYKLA